MTQPERSSRAAELVRDGLATTLSSKWDLEARTSVVFRSGKGASVVDVDGREYVDLTSCRGAAPLGIDFEPVVEAVTRALREGRGILPGTINEDRLALADDRLEVFPFAERVAFARTGSCATSMLVRLARVATGRELVVSSGFHGWHDWHLAPGWWGASGRTDRDVIDFGYDLDAATGLLDSLDGRVACVVVTHEPDYFPPAFLYELAELCSSVGVPLLLDEVMSGYRYGLGGVAGVLDLDVAGVTLSKGLANGTALSAVAGRGWLLEALEDTYVGHTYQREVTPFVAARATQDAWRDGLLLERIRSTGLGLMGGMNDVFERLGIGAAAIGAPSMFGVVFESGTLGERVYRRWLDEGVLAEYGGTHLPSAAMTAAQVEQAVEAFDRACRGALDDHGSPPAGGEPGHVGSERLTEVGRAAIGATRRALVTWMPEHVDRMTG
jgi:glutamate-1-semialdehyde 2,1-aminomutase/neamine transaminase/2'-deamino-2'-hydroxyneamine transaminase/neomycin C transaminase